MAKLSLAPEISAPSLPVNSWLGLSSRALDRQQLDLAQFGQNLAKARDLDKQRVTDAFLGRLMAEGGDLESLQALKGDLFSQAQAAGADIGALREKYSAERSALDNLLTNALGRSATEQEMKFNPLRWQAQIDRDKAATASSYAATRRANSEADRNEALRDTSIKANQFFQDHLEITGDSAAAMDATKKMLRESSVSPEDGFVILENVMGMHGMLTPEQTAFLEAEKERDKREFELEKAGLGKGGGSALSKEEAEAYGDGQHWLRVSEGILESYKIPKEVRAQLLRNSTKYKGWFSDTPYLDKDTLMSLINKNAKEYGLNFDQTLKLQSDLERHEF